MTVTKLVIDKQELNQVKQVAHQLIMEDVRGNQHDPVNRDLLLLEALELYLMRKGIKPQFTVKNGVSDI